MPARPRPAHVISPWLLALLAVVVYLGLATALFAFDLRVDVGIPKTAVLATPLGMYALVVFLAQPRFRAPRYLAAVAAVTGVH
ncbi:MAG: hypothetical protein HY216_02135, partial [Candidatus Rokubacteria bacterium]|nr:hypothetical protein [Candidatus Rokubacteria bacterium]